MIRALALVLAFALAACGASPRGPGGPNAPLLVSPSSIVTTEIAFARMVREEGFAKAYREYAADDAIVFDVDGPKPVREWLTEQSGDFGEIAWDTRRVLMSCDGSVAASLGTFTHPLGLAGTYATVWQRQRNGDYRFLVDFAFPGDEWEGQAEVIETRVGECKTSSTEERAAGYSPIYAEMDRDARDMNVDVVSGISQDTSLAWFAGHRNERDRGIMLSVFIEGEWNTYMGQRIEATDPFDAVIPE